MGEMHTAPIEPTLSLSCDKGDQKRNQPRKSKRDYEKEIENLSKELGSCKLELEAKHGAHMQALLKLEHNQKMTYELSTLMKKSDTERNKYMKECIEARARIHELESKIKDMTNQRHPETTKVQGQERNDDNDNDEKSITISIKEYKSLVKEAKRINEVEVEVGSHSELKFLKEELESATMRIVELGAEAEEALMRAELAEKGKETLENKIKRQREHRHRKRAAIAALREVCTPQHFSPSTSYGTPKVCQPLGKVLNLKL